MIILEITLDGFTITAQICMMEILFQALENKEIDLVKKIYIKDNTQIQFYMWVLSYKALTFFKIRYKIYFQFRNNLKVHNNLKVIWNQELASVEN